MWQEIAVYLIGCVTIFWMGHKIYRFLPVLFQTNQVAKVVRLVHSKNKDAKLPHAKSKSRTILSYSQDVIKRDHLFSL